ncbi:MAG: class I SAM-dependent methyltransferase [Planctomycetota bacterium]|jgi:SAM-dependent methyltransferase
MLDEAAYTNVYCPVCRHELHEHYHTMGQYELVQCAHCGFVFTKDIPSDRFFNEVYAPSYQPAEDNYRPRFPFHRRLKYLVFAKIVKLLCRRSPTIRLLDVGCNQGDLLRVVHHDRRFDAVGIDLAEAPLEYARSLGLDVHLSDLESMRFAEGTFDMIVAHHVLEHVQNPERLVVEIHRVLKPGGYFFAVVPCISHIKARLAGRKWHYLSPPAHLWYFSPATLSAFVERLGFEALYASCFHHRAHLRLLAKRATPHQPEMRDLWMGANNAGATGVASGSREGTGRHDGRAA